MSSGDRLFVAGHRGMVAQCLRETVGYAGTLRFDASKPDGAPRKLLDCSLINRLGWRPRVGLEEGLQLSYAWFLSHQQDRRD